MRIYKLSYVVACLVVLGIGFISGLAFIPDGLSREDAFWERTLTTYVYHKGFTEHGQLAEGWLNPDEEGTWSSSKRSTLVIDFQEHPPRKDLELEFVFDPFLMKKHRSQTVRVSVNGNPVGIWRLSGGSRRRLKSVHVKSSVWNARHPKKIDFEYSNPVSPAKLGVGPDREDRAIRLSSLVIRKLH